jgi:broad specificity phosphatase PhoE
MDSARRLIRQVLPADFRYADLSAIKYTGMKYFPLLLIIIMFASCGYTHYIYVVRHADKQDDSPLSLLSQAGHQRAVILKDSLINKKIGAIYVTPIERTQQTAKPLADALKITPIVYRPNAIDSMVNVLKNNNKNILVVGHAEPLPEIIGGLTGQKVNRPGGYDNFYIIKITKGKAELIAEKYGPPAN